MQTRKIMSTALAVLAVTVTAIGILMLCTTSEVVAQREPDRDRESAPPRRQPPPERGGQREFGPGRGGQGRFGAMPPLAGMRGGVALAAHGEYVYVLRGNTLYQFAAKDLKLVNKVTLEEDRPMGQPGGPRRRPTDRRPGSDRSPRIGRPETEQQQ